MKSSSVSECCGATIYKAKTPNTYLCEHCWEECNPIPTQSGNEIKTRRFMIPKKLNYGVGPVSQMIVVDDLVSRFNQLIDYLQAKEEASKGECPAIKLFSAWATTEEQRKLYDDMAVKHLKTNCTCHPNPPEHEESRGECSEVPCTHCTYGNPSCHICHNPQLKEESHKEDEWEDELHEYSENGVLPVYFITEYIKDNFVSKEKIKKRLGVMRESILGATMGQWTNGYQEAIKDFKLLLGD